MKTTTDNNRLQEATGIAERYFDGATSLAEEARLRILLADYSLQDPLLDEARAVMGYALFAPQAAVRKKRRRYRWVAAAGIAVVVVAGLSVVLSDRFDGTALADTSQCVAYVGGKKVTDRQTVLAMVDNDLSEFSAAFAEINRHIDDQMSEFASFSENMDNEL